MKGSGGREFLLQRVNGCERRAEAAAGYVQSKGPEMQDIPELQMGVELRTPHLPGKGTQGQDQPQQIPSYRVGSSRPI